MTSQSETGHAKNVANFEKLITNVTGFGTVYNPSKENIKLPALNAQLASAKGAISEINSAESAYKNAVSIREAAFAPLGKLITRVNNSLKASGSTSHIEESVMTLVRKMQGRRATPKLTDEEKKAAESEGKEVKQISSSQMSYDNRLDNFDKLIKLLASEPEYTPNEPELTINALTKLCNDLSAKNTDVINAAVPLTNARIVRNNVIYAPITGIIDISVDVKTYVKSVFGATSPQYKAISGLTFTNRK
jgi:multidrug resistance efflux pump